jgi:hypothetical protein
MFIALCTTLLAAASPARSKMPEPLLGESITDLDGAKAGEVEIDLNGMTLRRATTGGAWSSSLEAEWRALERLGLGLEVGFGGPLGSPGGAALSLRVAASFVLLHDFARDTHLMLEAGGRLIERPDVPGDFEPGESALPYSLGLRGGVRGGWLTLRGFLGAGAGDHSAHLVPLQAQVAALTELGANGRWGFYGVELDGDWARNTPFVLAPNFVLDAAPLGVRLKMGLALPWTVGARKNEPALGILVRFMFELDND